MRCVCSVSSKADASVCRRVRKQGWAAQATSSVRPGPAWKPGVEARRTAREPEAGASRAGAARLGREPAGLRREASLMPAGALGG